MSVFVLMGGLFVCLWRCMLGVAMLFDMMGSVSGVCLLNAGGVKSRWCELGLFWRMFVENDGCGFWVNCMCAWPLCCVMRKLFGDVLGPGDRVYVWVNVMCGCWVRCGFWFLLARCECVIFVFFGVFGCCDCISSVV